MKRTEIGLNIGEEGMHYFGLDELNDLIRGGHRVLRIVPGEVLVADLSGDGEEEIPEGEGSDLEQYSVSGFTMQVELEEP